MRRIAILTAVTVAVLALVGCTPTSGKVTDKQEKSGVYELRIHAKVGGDGWVVVDKTAYDRCDKGEAYPDCAGSRQGD